MKISIIDTETTGLDKDVDSVLEIAVVNFDAKLGDVIDSMSTLVKGASAEKIKAMQHVHGITPEMIAEWGAPTDAAMKMAAAMFMESEAILAHNAEFDQQWMDPATYGSIPWVCTKGDIKWSMELAKNSLVDVALAHGVGVASAHRAMDDCMTLARLLKRAAERGNLVEMIKRGMRPKVKVRALVSYADREKAKKAGFNWDPSSREWTRLMPEEDVKDLDFRVAKVFA